MNVKNTLKSWEKHAKNLQIMHKKITKKMQWSYKKNYNARMKEKLVYLFLVGLVGLDAFQFSMMIKQW
jgi:hypothetical protein